MLDNQIILLAIAGAGLLLSIMSLIIAVNAHVKYKKLFKQYDYFMRGKDAETLEDYFVELQRHVEILEDEDRKNKELIRALNKNIRASFQKFGLVKYNAFGSIVQHCYCE